MSIMTTKFKLDSARLITHFIIMMAFIATFTSCSKKDIKNAPVQNESFALNDNSTIIMPDAGVGVTTTESAQSNSSLKYNTFYGPQVQMGNGHARSWINISHDGKPLAIGIEMTDGALQDLPQNPEDFAASTFILQLHQKAKSVTPFDHLVINWNVHGHEPQHVYDIPHFDFHFYKIPLAAQLAIPPYPVAPAAFDNDPPAGYMPPLYLHTPGGVPQMGAHWVDLLSGEFNGQLFTHTFIYGSYNGHVTFEEPMITLATLQSGNTIHKDFRQPEHFDPANTNYPTRYNIWQDNSNNRHYLSLDNMVWR
jgi:hypothetical protein